MSKTGVALPTQTVLRKSGEQLDCLGWLWEPTSYRNAELRSAMVYLREAEVKQV
jgi:hypothetical protein